MSWHNQSFRAYCLFGVVVNLLGFSEHCLIGGKRRYNLLVAISGELIVERFHGVEFCIEGCLHLQLVIDEKINIFLHRFLINDSLGIILVVRIFKL